jgi:CMP-N-acetylneuraminic acid synthetase
MKTDPLHDSRKKTEVLAIIPARGGSKGIPRKNIVDLCGKPLIAYSIEAALKSSTITKVVVSTEDEEIADVSKAYGAEVPFLRPRKLAGDRCNVGDAIKYTLEQLKQYGFLPHALVQLYPTHPFRNPRLLNLLTAKLFEGYRNVKTARPVQLSSFGLFSTNGGNNVFPLLSRDVNGNGDRQVYFRSYGLFTATNLTGCQPRELYVYPLRDAVSLIDIDTYEDLYLAQEVIRQELFNFDLK